VVVNRHANRQPQISLSKMHLLRYGYRSAYWGNSKVAYLANKSSDDRLAASAMRLEIFKVSLSAIPGLQAESWLDL
jgi:hypothetical protein